MLTLHEKFDNGTGYTMDIPGFTLVIRFVIHGNSLDQEAADIAMVLRDVMMVIRLDWFVILQNNQSIYSVKPEHELCHDKTHIMVVRPAISDQTGHLSSLISHAVCSVLRTKVFMSKVNTVKPVLSGHYKRRPKLVLKTDYSLMQVESIAECFKRAFCNTFDLH